jgi:hypothetical protein
MKGTNMSSLEPGYTRFWIKAFFIALIIAAIVLVVVK